MTFDLAATLAGAKIIPVLTIEDAASAPDLARALAAAGLTTLEVTLRTPAALAAMEAIARAAPDITIAAGTVLTPADLSAAKNAGARFAVSPGLTPALLEADRALPWLPGVATASEIMMGLAAGLSLFKFFPAESAGGVAALAAFAGPFPQVRFCPTGGVNRNNVGAYRARANVICVGGSWMIDAIALEARRWDDLTIAAKEATAI